MESTRRVPWLATFGIAAACTVAGNLIFLAIYVKSDNLRRMRTSVLLVSLAAADLIVGAVTIPMYMAVLWLGAEGTNNSNVLAVYRATDILSGFASLFGLAVIALERVYSVFWPHKHRALTKTTYYVALAVIWVLSVLLAALSAFVAATRTYLLLPLMAVIVAVVTLCYCAVWAKLRRSRPCRHEKKLAKTLAIVTGIFLITWLPFFVINWVFYLCVQCWLHLDFLFAAKLLHFSNSFANPIVYPFRFPEVRRILVKVFCRRERASARVEDRAERAPGPRDLVTSENAAWCESPRQKRPPPYHIGLSGLC